jgi:molybdenum cofactor biosynthesis enzyme MoaA
LTHGREPPIPLLRPRLDAHAGGFDLSDPRGLRALPEVWALGLGADVLVHAHASVEHTLENQAELERAFTSAPGPVLVLTLRGPLSLSAAELARLAPAVPLAQVEAAIRFLVEASRRHAPRLRAEIAPSMAPLSPQATVVDLREYVDGILRHGLDVDPLGASGTFDDPAVAAIAASVGDVTTPHEKVKHLLAALESSAGPARGARHKLQLLPSRRARDGHAPTIQEVVLARTDDPRSARQRAADAIVAVRATARLGARTLVLSSSGAELEWYVEDLTGLAHGLGFEQVEIEVGPQGLRERAASLAKAGVTTVRITMGQLELGADEEEVWLAARALLGAGVPVRLVVPAAPGGREPLVALVASVARRLPPSAARLEKVVVRILPSLGVSEAVATLQAVAGAAAQASVSIDVAPGTELPPCVFTDLAEMSSLLRLSEGLVAEGDRGERTQQHRRIALCETCGARHVCPGPLQARAVDVTTSGRRLAPGTRGIPPTEERRQVLHELRSVILRPSPDGRVQERRVLRINFHCNQACDFCFVSRQLPPPEDSLVESELLDAARAGATLAISGGEPTINPRLPDYIARATELGIRDLELQTNAIKMSDRGYASTLARAGLPLAFVSLHGTTAATSDRVTSAPGTFDKTVEGIRNLLREGVQVRVNFVVCGYNASEFPALPDFVERELRSVAPGVQVMVNFSFVAPSSNVPRDVRLVPRFSEVAWALAAALDRAEALHLPMVGFDSQCGVPPCFLPERIRASAFAEDLPAEEVAAFEGSFRKAAACEGCSLTKRCYGVRAGYAEMYGTSELHAV